MVLHQVRRCLMKSGQDKEYRAVKKDICLSPQKGKWSLPFWGDRNRHKAEGRRTAKGWSGETRCGFTAQKVDFYFLPYGSGKLGELTQPHLLIAAASGMEATARESIHLHSGEHTAITAERDLSISVGRSWHAAVQEKLTVFIYRLVARIIAAMGVIWVEAEGDELQLLGQKTVTLQSNEDWVRITGKKGVIINGGGSYLKVWDGGIEYGTKDGWIVYSKKHGLAGPRSLPAPVSGKIG
jgi:uncharacterized protein (DUF2345 family)